MFSVGILTSMVPTVPSGVDRSSSLHPLREIRTTSITAAAKIVRKNPLLGDIEYSIRLYLA